MKGPGMSFLNQKEYLRNGKQYILVPSRNGNQLYNYITNDTLGSGCSGRGARPHSQATSALRGIMDRME
jgi:hypothetical protein